MASDFFASPPWTALTLTALCSTQHGTWFLSQFAIADGSFDNLIDHHQTLASMASAFHEHDQQEISKMAKASLAVVPPAPSTTRVELQDGTFVNIPNVTPTGPRPAPPPDPIVQLRADIELKKGLYEISESREDWDAWKAAERDLEFAIERAKLAAARRATQRAIVESPDYKARLASAREAETRAKSDYQRLVSEQAERVIAAFGTAAAASDVEHRAYRVAARLQDLQAEAGQRIGNMHSSIPFGLFGAEVRLKVIARCQELGISAAELDRLVGG